MASDQTYQQRLTALSRLLASHRLDAWLVPVNDEFQGEYVPSYAERLSWLTGFHASAGVAIIVREGVVCRYALLVDGRYITQAQEAMDSSVWDVHNSASISVAEWLTEHLPPSSVLGCDAWLHSHQAVQRLQTQLVQKGYELSLLSTNLVDVLWEDRPVPPAGSVSLFPLSIAGISTEDKISAASYHLEALALDAYIITQPDTIAWLLNIRGADIPFNPLLLSYAVLFRTGHVVLITHNRSFPEDIRAHFAACQVECLVFSQCFGEDCMLAPKLSHLKIGADAGLTPARVWQWAKTNDLSMAAVEDFLQLMRACKPKAEQQAMREAHLHDAVSVIECLAELEATKDEGLSELEVVALLEQHRSADVRYKGASFATISGSGPNGAIVHYRVSEQTNRIWQEGELLLLDSGGQYEQGTTDITRVLARGKANAEHKDRYTRVLKGHIALARANFPKGTTGRQLDTLARQFLWQVGCDYDHGTGHGVGTYLCVHEGPQRISKKGSDVALHAGMVISNEPGYYKAGDYGIRIENLVMVVESDDSTMLAFETLTLVPIETRLIDNTLMHADEVAWLNSYHVRVYESVAPLLRSDRAKTWLKKACSPI